MSDLSMTRAEREIFLADLYFGVISIDESDRAPLTVPIWYDFDRGPRQCRGSLEESPRRVQDCLPRFANVERVGSTFAKLV